MAKLFANTKKALILLLIDSFSVFVSSILAIYLGQGPSLLFDLHYFKSLAINLVFMALIFFSLNLHKFALKTAGIHEAVRIVVACSVVFVLDSILVHFTHYFTYQQAAVYVVFLTVLTGGVRFSRRILTMFQAKTIRERSNVKRVLIVGAGEAGAQLSREILSSSRINYNPVCFVDDNDTKVGDVLNGIKVVGTTKDIVWAVNKYDIDEIFIAIPSAPKLQIKKIVELCQPTKLPIKTLPGLYQFVSGDRVVSSLRNVDVADLLGRDEVKVNLEEISKYIKDEVVLVTGGGGSIGSELCRQIANALPKQLIIFDIYENNAYDIEQELKRHHPELNLVALIGSIRDEGKLRSVFNTYKPTIVFNAAAHKHVPLMETSPNEAIKNNAIGTLNLARISDETKVKTFVQISTDKAVNPTNIMGASKRICEMIIQTIGKHSKNTNFVAVRFGNVLGSNGSVIPLFKKQIEEGGPITLTHRDIIRYFMTIPEAVSLVLEAGAYAKKGQIFVLDMGEPVRIYDLAVNLVKLSGLTPGQDIELKEIGLRPGEKLFEERLMNEEGLEKTANGLISIAKPIEMSDEKKFFNDLEHLNKLAHEETDEMKELVAKLVPTYKVDKR